jgi:hypothetical protein
MAGSVVKDHFFEVPRQNKAFVHRPEIFKKVEEALRREHESSEGCRIVALKGLGGMGKTQLAIRYCYVHRSTYNYVFWLKAEGKVQTYSSFRKLAGNLGFDDSSVDKKDVDEKAVQWSRSWLQKSSDWLIVLDNLDGEMRKEVFKLLPTIGGDVILTTREPIPATMAEIIHINKMTDDEALSLIYAQPYDEINQETAEFKNAKKIIDMLDNMPLAMTLARAYMKNTRTSFEKYLQKFIAKSKNLLNYSDEDVAEQHKDTVASVWDITFDRLKELDPMTEWILEACTFLQPDSIPTAFFMECYSTLQRGWSNDSAKAIEADIDERIGRALALLIEFSFLSEMKPSYDFNLESSVVAIHRLVQKVIYERMADEKRERWARNIACSILEEIGDYKPYSNETKVIMGYIYNISCISFTNLSLRGLHLLSRSLRKFSVWQ